MEEIFYCLEPNQCEINSLEKQSLKPIHNKLQLFKNKYSNNIYFIIFILNNIELLSNTMDEQISLFDKNITSIIENINKNNLFNKFEYTKNKLIKKKTLIEKLNGKNFNGYDIYKFLVDFYKINIYIVIDNYVFSFINNDENKNYIFQMEDKNYYLLNYSDYNISDKELGLFLEDKIIIDETVFLTYKNLKINELKDLANKYDISLSNDKKVKTKSLLIDDISLILSHI